jgi:hypothetical protein
MVASPSAGGYGGPSTTGLCASWHNLPRVPWTCVAKLNLLPSLNDQFDQAPTERGFIATTGASANITLECPGIIGQP